MVLEAFVERVEEFKLAPDYRREKLPVFWQNGPTELPVTLVPAAADR